MVPSVWLLINDHVASDLRGEEVFPERFAVRLVYHLQLSAFGNQCKRNKLMPEMFGENIC
jgi:hypothetical protein